jgi:chemotaxis protein CheD
MNDIAGEKKVNIIQGEFKVSKDPQVVLTTLLGSCVAACIRDPLAGVGGMNHFLLPGDTDHAGQNAGENYGVHLMELLINGLMREGAKRDRLEAKLFGGARMMKGLSDIGQRNSEFAMRFLKYESIQLVGSDFGGERGRRITYSPATGLVRQMYVGNANIEPVMPKLPAAPAAPSFDDFELFTPNIPSARR